MLQRCVFLRDYLGLSVHKSTAISASLPHIKISSKALQESYSLPDDGVSIENVFTKLADLMQSLRVANKRPPRTDFTCLSRLKRKKVCLDIDCMPCKRGDVGRKTRHFSSTKLLNHIVAKVAEVFEETISEGVYLTNGSSSCGYHVFFNTLSYDTNGVTEPKLMDALDASLKLTEWAGIIAIDRRCTQMPLPTAMHANSSKQTVPSKLIHGMKEWQRERMSWANMDADTLKCFSCIGFPERYDKDYNKRNAISVPALSPNKLFVTTKDIDVGPTTEMPTTSIKNNGGKRSHGESEVESKIDDDCANTCSPPTKKKCLSTAIETIASSLVGIESDNCINTNNSGPLPDEQTTMEVEETQNEGSLLSAFTEVTGTTSFMGSRVSPGNGYVNTNNNHQNQGKSIATVQGGGSKQMPPPTCKDLKKNKTKRRQTESNIYEKEPSMVTNVIERYPYECENDKCSAFVDKQYKASLLCAEELEANISAARLQQDNRGVEKLPRVYVVPGSSSNITREYQLLMQLVNVKRSVYGGDVSTRREWTELITSYYNQHVRNPIILEMLKYMFKETAITDLFEQHDLEEINNAIIHLMSEFKTSKFIIRHMSSKPSADETEKEEEFLRETKPQQTLLVGAIIRVCTQMFGMVTAVISDFNNVQKRKEKADLTLLNRTVVNGRSAEAKMNNVNNRKKSACAINPNVDDDMDCSASMYDGESILTDATTYEKKSPTIYSLLATLILHEQDNLSDQALYAFLYYYNYFPFETISRIMNEIHHDGLMVTAMIQSFLTHGHHDRALTLKEIFEGFKDVVISLDGHVQFVLKMMNENKKANLKTGDVSKNKCTNNSNPRRQTFADENSSNSCPSNDGDDYTNEIVDNEVKKLMSGPDRKRRRKMCNYPKSTNGSTLERITYEWQLKHLWRAVINYYFRPVGIHEDKMVYANDTYDTLEEDAVDSCLAHLKTYHKNTKSDIVTAFKDARTMWRMPHGSQLVYECDLKSNVLGCRFHINNALKMYEMYCGGCVTQMRRVHKNYLIDRTRFNMEVFDVVAECRKATIDLTSKIDLSYMNIMLCLPVVPPFFEEMDVRQLFLSKEEIQRGSFCCLTLMDYVRVINLFERSNCLSRSEVENCDYVETFLDNLYTNEVSANHPPNPKASEHMRRLFLFYSLFLYEVLFNMRHAYLRRENCHVSIERLCNELDIRELLVLFFGESSMRRVEGLGEELDNRIYQTMNGLSTTHVTSSRNQELVSEKSSANARFDVRPILSMDIPHKMARMKTLFGQFGFDVMQDGGVMDTAAVNGPATETIQVVTQVPNNNSKDNSSSFIDENMDGGEKDRFWEDESKFEEEFYVNSDWFEKVCLRIGNAKVTGKSARGTAALPIGGGSAHLFVRETVNTIMRLELKRHIDNDRLGKLSNVLDTNSEELADAMCTLKQLPMRVKLLALILTTHTVKLKTKTLASDFVETRYREADGHFADEHRVYEGNENAAKNGDEEEYNEPPEKIWCRRTETLLDDRRSLLLHARWLAEQRFDCNFFVGLDPVHIYSVLYEYMKDNENQYPAFKSYNDNPETANATRNLCTAMMYLLIMSSYDQEHVDLYLKLFLAVEWPGQWAKTIFVWKSNSNAGKSYLFDSIIKRACATSTCINDPKGGKENAPEKAEYVRNFVLFAHEFSQANSNELKKLVSESTFKFRMNYGNVMNEAYTTGKIMFNCNTLPPTSDEAAINRLTLFNIPFWFCRRQKISDAMLNWVRGLSVADCTRWELACRYELPALLTDEEKNVFETHGDTKDETDLFNGYAAIRPNMFSADFSRATSSMFLAQNKTSRLYVITSPPTDRIVHGLVNITTHFSWLRFFKRIDMPVDFSTLPAASEYVRSVWLSLTLPYQEWKQLTGARADPSGRVPVDAINRSLQTFAAKKNVNYFGIKQFFETDFASSRETIKDEYYICFNPKGVGE